MFSTITAKFAATCKRCKGPIAVGQKMRYGGRGRTYHLKAQCPAASAQSMAVDYSDLHPDDEAEATARGYHNPRAVSHYTRFAGGAEVFTNKSGRCEDAPCCGCCS